MATINSLNNGIVGADFTITAGSASVSAYLSLPTTSSTAGQILINNVPHFHAYGTQNIFAGNSSGNFTLSGTANTCYGYNTGTAISSGSNNCLIGNQSGQFVSTGSGNTLLGHQTGYKDASHGLTTGNYNTVVGALSATAWTGSESSNIYIGYGVTGASESNVLRIGNGTGTSAGNINATYISGITGRTATGGAAVYCNSSNVLGTLTSNRDSKFDIEDMGAESSVIYNLRARTFKFKADTDPKPKQYGFIAEEVEPVFPEMVLYDLDGKMWNLSYHFLAPMLVNEMQKLQARIKVLEDKLV